MTEQEPIETRLARIEEHIKAIHDKLKDRPPIRHVNHDGVCDAYHTVISHDRRMNQWIGFTAAISLLFSIIGAAIVAALSWLHK